MKVKFEDGDVQQQSIILNTSERIHFLDVDTFIPIKIKNYKVISVSLFQKVLCVSRTHWKKEHP